MLESLFLKVGEVAMLYFHELAEINQRLGLEVGFETHDQDLVEVDLVHHCRDMLVGS